MGKPVKPDKPGKISDATQGMIDKIKECAKLNDWAGIKKAYDKIDWKDDEIAKSFIAVAKEVPKNKDTKVLRREIKTKYELLREDTNDIVELSDIDAYAVPVVKLVPIIFNGVGFPVIEIGGLKFTYLDMLTLNPDVLNVLGVVIPVVRGVGIDVPFVRISDRRFELAMADWSRRWGIAIDAVGTDGMMIIPHPATALGQKRASLMLAIEKRGWTPETEAMWAKYYQDLSIALSRIRLNKKKK